MNDAFSKFGTRRKEFESDLQALGLGGSNKDIIRQAIDKSLTGVNAALNVVLPGISKLLQSTAFKGATGKGLGTLEKIEDQSGQKLTATTREGMQSQMGNMQTSLANNLKELIEKISNASFGYSLKRVGME